MSKLVKKMMLYFYRDYEHPYRIFESKIEDEIRVGDVLLDIGCGREAPVLKKFKAVAGMLIGVDLVEARLVDSEITYFQGDASSTPLADGSVDLIISRSVFEHLENPLEVYREMSRVLRRGGKIIFLTASLYDYGTLIARIIPNRYHARVVRKTEGRPEEDTFPTKYLTNSLGDIERLCVQSGLSLLSIRYLNQYPNYLLFNPIFFLMGVLYERITSRFDFLRALRGWILVDLQKL